MDQISRIVIFLKLWFPFIVADILFNYVKTKCDAITRTTNIRVAINEFFEECKDKFGVSLALND